MLIKNIIQVTLHFLQCDILLTNQQYVNVTDEVNSYFREFLNHNVCKTSAEPRKLFLCLWDVPEGNDTLMHKPGRNQEEKN